MKKHFAVTQVSILTIILMVLLSFPVAALQQQIGMPQADEVVATVNGEEIMLSELEGQANIMGIMMQLQQLPQFAEFLQTTPEGQEFLVAYQRYVLEGLIDQKLLQMEAKQQGITVSEEEKEDFAREQIDMIRVQQGLSDEEILTAVQQQLGLDSIEAFKAMIIEQEGENLVLQKFISEVVVEKVNISEDDARAFYEQEQLAMQGIEFDQVKENIKQYMAQEKYIELLRQDADIEIKF